MCMYLHIHMYTYTHMYIYVNKHIIYIYTYTHVESYYAVTFGPVRLAFGLQSGIKLYACSSACSREAVCPWVSNLSNLRKWRQSLSFSPFEVLLYLFQAVPTVPETSMVTAVLFLHLGKHLKRCSRGLCANRQAQATNGGGGEGYSWKEASNIQTSVLLGGSNCVSCLAQVLKHLALPAKSAVKKNETLGEKAGKAASFYSKPKWTAFAALIFQDPRNQHLSSYDA